MKKKASAKKPRHLDKHLFEAGQQCQKRLWLDYHEPIEQTPATGRQLMSAVGQQLLALARSAFPKGVLVEAEDADAAAAETARLLAAETPVVFHGAFVADGVEVRSDIVVRHRDGALDLYEVKSGTKIKHRYVNDLALQVHVVALAGHKVNAVFLLHVNPAYVHKADTDFPAMQLLRSADVTAKVHKQAELVRRRLQQFRLAIDNDKVLQLPMGTFCTAPFPCPQLARCSKQSAENPLRELPELSRAFEVELQKEGVRSIDQLDAERPGLTFRQKRTITCVQKGEPLVEPFVREELRQCDKPLHFLAITGVVDPLPRFDGQRPWRLVPYAWAAQTMHPDGRIESAAFTHVERTDPRTDFITSLARHLEVGGTIVCWDAKPLEEMRALLDDLPAAKAAVRAVLGRSHVDLMLLFESGVFHPQLRSHADLRRTVATWLGDHSGDDLPVYGEDDLREALNKAATPRIRSTTRDKLAGEIQAGVVWTSERMLDLYRKFAEVEVVRAPKTVKAAAAKTRPKPLPKPLPPAAE
ncbi:MAG: DUF2779 domain-containing protein [Planctomycetes bacterium]|nr:DUF2779 domain-containing protein [Planctomycetota bacterium]